MTRSRVAVVSTLAAAALAVAGPIALALILARREAIRSETARTLAYAQDALGRSEATADQILQAVAALVAADHGESCSPQIEGLMRRLDVASSYIQAIGRVRNDTIVCSSLGKDAGSLPLGPVDFSQDGGAGFRLDVRLPFAPATSFLVIEKDGFAAVIHKGLPIDVTTLRPDVTLGTFAISNHRILTARGRLDVDWLRRLGDSSVTVFLDRDRLVTIVRSGRFLIGALAAAPTTSISERLRQTALLLVPVGLVAGLILAVAVLHLARQQLAMPAVIRAALRREEYSLAYQPTVDLRTGRWVGAEALIRWRRPGGEMVRPDLFIPVAEDAGLIQRVTERVLELAARDAAGFFARHREFHLGINLSAADLHDPRTAELVLGLARATGAGPRNLMIEATERGFTDPRLAEQVVTTLRANGVLVAIDDFGTGYASLSQLENLALDYLKIDRAFVESIGTTAVTSEVVPHIVDMARALHLEIIAEGVETEVQAGFLRDLGVHYAQGYLFGRPMPFARLVECMEAGEVAAAR